ncbi:MAG: hypothetical protein ACE5JF_10870 [Anaerolineales bacterium]
MVGVLKVARRTLIWAFIQGTILLGFTGINPFSNTSLVIRALMLIVAIVLAASLIPNSYLRRFAANASDERPKRGSGLLLLVSIFGPLLMVIVSIAAISVNLDNLKLIDQLGTPFIDPRSATYIIIQFAVLGFISLAALAWNLLNLIRSRGTEQVA